MLFLQAQNINKGEYFFDKGPAIGRVKIIRI
jgi:hypothetical protein